jgi:GT2 family glycosyltransferase
MIPVIGTAIVNSTTWVRRLISSVDFPVENFIIVNNNGRGNFQEDLRQLSMEYHPFIQKIHIVNMPSNIGVAASWNLFIKSFINAPFWIITNDDVAFDTGFLEEMYTVAITDIDAGIIHGYPGDFECGSWDVFLIKDFVIQECGLFDENMYPAYCEDVDYLMRLHLTSIKRVLTLNSNYFHGYGSKGEYSEHGSQTQKTEPEISSKLDFANWANMDYLTEKWGTHWRTQWPYREGPFQKYPISYTTFDLSFIRKKHLGF